MRGLTFGALVLVLAAFAAWAWLGRGTDGGAAAVPAGGTLSGAVAEAGPGAGGAAPAEAEGGPSSARVACEDRLAQAFAADLPVYPARRRMAALSGIVVDAKGLPVLGARVSARPTPGHAPQGLALGDDRGSPRELVTAGDGCFCFPALPEGPWLVEARDAQDREASADAALSSATCAPRLRLALAEVPDAERDLVVRVVDAQGAPVAGARVEAVLGARAALGARPVLAGAHGSPPLRATADANGRAVFAGVRALGVVACARAGAGACGIATLFRREAVVHAMREGGLRVVVAAPGKLAGQLTGVPAEEVEGARVVAHAMTTEAPYSLLTYDLPFEARVRGGAYAFPALPAADYALTLEHDSGVRQVLPRWRPDGEEAENSIEPLRVGVAAGAAATCDLACSRGAVLAGTVRDEAGKPVAGAVVVTMFGPKNATFIDTHVWRGLPVLSLDHEDPIVFAGHAATHPFTTTDRDGRFRLAGLQPGRHRVEARAARRAVERRLDVATRDGETTTLDFVLTPAGALQGVGDPGHLLVLRRAEASVPSVAARLPRSGAFVLPGLAAGRYAVGVTHPDADEDAIFLCEVEIVAGRTTLVDLLAHGEHALEGRLLGAEGPIAGATVAFSARRVATDERGRFELRIPNRVGGELELEVESGPLRWTVRLEARPPGVAAWPGDLMLGSLSAEFRCEGSDGQPCAATISVSGEARCGRPLAGLRLESAEVWVEAAAAARLAGLEPGTYHAAAAFADGTRAEREFELPATGPVVLRAPVVGELAVLVRDLKGQPVAGVLVEIESLAEREAEARNAEAARVARAAAALQGAAAQVKPPPPHEAGAGRPASVEGMTKLAFEAILSESLRNAHGVPFLKEWAIVRGDGVPTDATGVALFRGLAIGEWGVRLRAPEGREGAEPWPEDQRRVRVLPRQRAESAWVVPR